MGDPSLQYRTGDCPVTPEMNLYNSNIEPNEELVYPIARSYKLAGTFDYDHAGLLFSHNAQFTVKDLGSLELPANYEIVLNPGFEVEYGAAFDAYITDELCADLGAGKKSKVTGSEMVDCELNLPGVEKNNAVAVVKGCLLAN